MSPLTHDVESKADEAVMSRQRQQNLIHEQNVLEVVDDALSVKEVHSRCKKVPVQGLGEAKVLLLAGDVGDGNNFLERDDLNGSHNADDVDVAREHGDEKAGNHHEGPYRPGNEGLFLLLVFGLGGLLRDQRKESVISYNSAIETQAHLFRDCGRLRDAAVAGVGWFRDCIADIGRHARPPLTFLVIEPNIATRHDGR